MDTLPVTLVLASTAMHAAWNVLAKGRGSAEQCFWRMQLVIVAAGFLPAAAAQIAFGFVTGRAALFLLGSGLCCGFYYLSLAKGYESGDFTTVYPAARALPVLIIGVADVVRGHPPNAAGWCGMLLVVAGCLLVPLTSLRGTSWRHYWNRSSLWIVLTALGTVGYSLTDKAGTAAIPTGPLPALLYCYGFFLMTCAAYWGMRKAAGIGKRPTAAVGWRVPALAGALGLGSYWLVLWAYQLASRVSYVVAFRQFSIVIGVAVGIRVFREPGKRIRLAGALVITAGLILLKIGGG